MIPHELILKIFTYLPDHKSRKSFYSVAKKERTGRLKKLIEHHLPNPIIRKLTIRGKARMSKCEFSHTFFLIGKYLIYLIYDDYLEICDLTTGEVVFRVEECFSYYSEINLVKDEDTGKVNLDVFDTFSCVDEDSMYTRFTYELDIDPDGLNLKKHYCRFCEKHTSKHDEKHYTLICAKDCWILKVSRKSKECFCIDKETHRFKMENIHYELMDYFQNR